MKIKSSLQQVINFYKASPENRRHIHVFLGFVIIPLVGMISLYLYFTLWVLK